MSRLQDRVSCGGHLSDTTEDVLATALEAYISLDAAGTIVAWNRAARDTFGYSWEQACGRSAEELIVPPRMRAAHRAGIARVAGGGPGRVLGQRLQLVAQHADGHEFPIELTLTMTDGPAGRVFHALAHDVTVTYRAQRFTAVGAAVSRGLVDAASSTDAAQHVVDALGDSLAWPVAELWLVDDARRMLVCAARWTGRDVTDFCFAELEFDTGLPGRVCRTGNPHWIRDLAVDTAVRSRLAARYGLHVAVGVPIRSAGSVFGVLALYGDHVEDPEDSLTALLSGVAAQVGQYLERRRAEELTVELARTKDEFLALVAHELRNPLSVITSAAALFREEIHELSPAQQLEYLATITRSADRLSAMTGDLLYLARLESGHLAMRPGDTDLADIIGQAVSTAGPAAAHKDLTIAVHTDERLPVCADADRLLQVADNLLNNAIKYTPAGGTISIDAHHQVGHDGEQSIVWDVADTGIGIPAAERPRLFRRFYRASTAIEHRIPGTGLGLVITRAIIERHHGSITVADHDGPGTTFHIHLPATTVVLPLKARPGERQGGGNPPGKDGVG